MASYGVASRSGLASDHLLTSCLLLLCKRTCVCVLSTLHHQPECTAGRVPSKIERPQWRALRAAAAVVVGKPLIKFRARVRTYKGSENSSQWERDPIRTICQ